MATGGLPELDAAGFVRFMPLFAAFLIVPRMVGAAIAFAIYTYGKKALYDKNMAGLVDGERGYLYAAAVVFSFLVSWLNNYPMLYKSMVMRMGSGNLRANMMIYKTAGAEQGSPYVVLETEGPVGSYNRANRSLTHFTEYSIAVVLCVLLAGNVFPLPTLVTTAVFALGRIMHQVGYSAIGYGGHGAGFGIAMMSSMVLEMLCLVVAVKSLGLGLGGLPKVEL